MTDEVIYQPSRWQRAFHSLTLEGINEALGAGSAGPGKTTCLLNDCNDQIIIEHERCANKKHKHHIEWGKSRGWALHLRRTRLSLEPTIRESHRLFKGMDPGATWNEQKSTWTFSSGFRYQFGHCKDPNDWEGYFSAEFSALFFDELTEFLEEQYDQLCRRVRSSDPVLRMMLKIRSMSNPLMRRTTGEAFLINDPHWVRRRFVDPDPAGNKIFVRKLKRGDGSVVLHKWIYMPAKLSDNPDKEFVKSYEANLLNSPPHIRQALLEGNWYVTVGSFFAEYWKERLHTCEPFKIPTEWRVFRSMDWGFKRHGCLGWFALDDDETLYCFKEIKFRGKTDREMAAVVKATEQQLGLWDEQRDQSRIVGVADTQLWEKRGSESESMAEVFRKNGVPWRTADKKSRQTNAGHIIKRLEDHDNETKNPGLVFFNTCKYCIATLPGIQTSTENPEEPADGGDDHGYDMVSYACALASKGKIAIPARSEDRDDFDDDDEDPQAARRGRYGYGQELC